LLRGINVGTAKRVSMGVLRELIAGLGYTEVGTLLNSGNLVFSGRSASTDRLARRIGKAVEDELGVRAAVMVFTAEELEAIVAANPIAHATAEPSRFLVAFVPDTVALDRAASLGNQSWSPDAFAMGPGAAYLWCATGILESPLLKAFTRLTKESATTRNWATVLKLQVLAGSRDLPADR